MFHRQVIVMEPVVMTMSDTHARGAAPAPADSCDDHDYENIRPIVIASAKFGARSLDTAADSASAAIIAETQALFETIAIPGSVTRLVYSSPRSRGYLSTIQLQLTPDTVPATLRKIYLRITIEGELFEKIFEADPNLKYTYSWKGINVYRQRVYGTTTALVKVGYEYESCATIIWNVQVRYILRENILDSTRKIFAVDTDLWPGPQCQQHWRLGPGHPPPLQFPGKYFLLSQIFLEQTENILCAGGYPVQG